jgi:peroxiredoxin
MYGMTISRRLGLARRHCLCFFAATALIVGASATGAVRAANGPRAGDKAPAFSLKAVDNGAVRALADLSKEKNSQGVVLVFLSCRCPYVAQARQPLADLKKEFGDKMTFVGVNANQNESVDDIKADAALNFPFPMLRDEGAKVADAYAAERTPEVFVIDPRGIVRYHGGVGDLGAALREFTAGKAISKAEARAFGCTIKRKS